jgi:UDP-glucuronate 4-epimerase
MGTLPEPDAQWKGEKPDPATSYVNYRVYNIGNNRPVKLLDFIETLETVLGKKAEKEFKDLQPGDVIATYADIDDLSKQVGFTPKTPIEDGIRRFVDWYRRYYKIT